MVFYGLVLGGGFGVLFGSFYSFEEECYDYCCEEGCQTCDEYCSASDGTGFLFWNGGAVDYLDGGAGFLFVNFCECELLQCHLIECFGVFEVACFVGEVEYAFWGLGCVCGTGLSFADFALKVR